MWLARRCSHQILAKLVVCIHSLFEVGKTKAKEFAVVKPKQ